MKRKALLLATTCTAKAFETYSARDFLPFVIEDARWSEYTLQNAIELKILMVAAACMDQNSAAFLARQAFDKLHPIHPLFHTNGQEMWVALVRYDWAEAPEDWNARTVVAGRWQDLSAQAQAFVQGFDGKCQVVSIQAISASKIAVEVWEDLREIGLPEGEELPGVPQDLTGFPEWFIETETARRYVISNDWKPETEVRD